MIEFLRPNAVYLWNERPCRLLKNLDYCCIFIDIESTSALPFKVDAEDIDLHDEIVEIDDPWIEIINRAYTAGSVYLNKRDSNYERIIPLIQNDEFYDKNVRSAIVEILTAQSFGSKSTIYRYARRYWQRGQSINTLLPDYCYCGGKGKKKTRNGVRLGRPKEFGDLPNSLWSPALERMMHSALLNTIFSERYLIDKKGKKVNSCDLNAAYTDLLARFCGGDISRLSSGKPSKSMLKAYYNSCFTVERRAQAKHGEIYFKANNSQLTSSVRKDMVGPGSSYSIDSTPFDIGVANDDRLLLGRPVLYLCVDDYSSAITGFLLVLTPASYFNVVNAMTSAISNKVKLCAKHGMDIQQNEWPMEGLPKAFFADLGSDFRTKNIEAATSMHNISIINSGAGQPNKRGDGERVFGRIHAELRHQLPGLVSQYTSKKSGGMSSQKNYTMHLDELNKIILKAILVLNNKPLDKWDCDNDFPAELATTPNNIWKWGVAHRTGSLQLINKDFFWFSLLEQETATISNRNILTIDGVKYVHPELSGLRVKVNRSQQKQVVVRDKSDATAIFIVPSEGAHEYLRCELEPHFRRFKGLPWADVIDDLKKRKHSNANAQHSYEVKRTADFIENEKVTEVATCERKEAIDGLSKSEQVANLGDKSEQRRQSQTVYNKLKPELAVSNACINEPMIYEQANSDARVKFFMDEED